MQNMSLCYIGLYFRKTRTETSFHISCNELFRYGLYYIKGKPNDMVSWTEYRYVG